MIQNYELYLIFNPELTTDQITKEQEGIIDLLSEKLQAQNVNINSEGLRKMAYPISKHRTGFYLLITFDVDIANTK